jgi:hypothetical protein
VTKTSNAHGLQSEQKRPISETSDGGKPSDEKLKRLDKIGNYGSSGRTSVLNSSYRSSDSNKSDGYIHSGWGNQSKSNFQPSKFPKTGNTRYPQSAMEAPKTKHQSWRTARTFCSKLETHDKILRVISEGYKIKYFMKPPSFTGIGQTEMPNDPEK